MLHKFIICLMLLLQVMVASVQGQKLIQPGPPDSCFKTTEYHTFFQFHKDVPSPQGSDFPQCQSWKELSCCTRVLTEELDRSNTQGLDYTYDLCGAVSPRCTEYFRNDDCFYWCEPMLAYFQSGSGENIRDVPICSEYCDAWFDACKNDLTCFANRLENIDFYSTNANCSAPHTCSSFREVYKDGKGLCNTIWGSNYVYSTDADNCAVMTFNNSMPNPNFKLKFPRSGSVSKLMLDSILIYMSALFVFLLIADDIF